MLRRLTVALAGFIVAAGGSLALMSAPASAATEPSPHPMPVVTYTSTPHPAKTGKPVCEPVKCPPSTKRCWTEYKRTQVKSTHYGKQKVQVCKYVSYVRPNSHPSTPSHISKGKSGHSDQCKKVVRYTYKVIKTPKHSKKPGSQHSYMKPLS